MKRFLAMGFLVALPLSVAAAQPEKAETPVQRELFAKEEWYKSQAGQEQEFIGILSRQAGKAGVGIGRFNPFRLTMTVTTFQPVQKKVGKQIVVDNVPVQQNVVKEVYVGAQGDLLAPYVGKMVKLVGKPVQMEVVGRVHDEIWPARVEIMTAQPKPGAQIKAAGGKELKILATSVWPGAVGPNAPQKGLQVVVRDPMDLVNLHPWSQLDAIPQVVSKMAAGQLAKLFKVDSIDWAKQMVVVVVADVRPKDNVAHIDIGPVYGADGKVTVMYVEKGPAEDNTAGTASKAALVERFDGAATFVKENTKKVPVRKLPIDREQLALLEQDGKDPKILAQAKSRLVGGQGGHVVIRSEEELVKAAGGKANATDLLAKMAKQLKVESIDLKKHMIVVVSGGTQRTGGYSVSINGTKVDGKTLTVQWKLNTPPPGSIVTQALTNPAATALIERFEGDVQFDPKTAPGGLKGPLPIDR